MTPEQAKNLSYELRRKQEKLDNYALIASWAQDVSKQESFEVRLSWNYGSACYGYKEVEKAIRLKIENLMPQLIKEVVAEAEAELNGDPS